MKKIIISLILVILIVGGYYLYTKYGLGFNSIQKNPEETPVTDENLVQASNQSLLSSIGENVVLIVEQPPSVEIMAHGVKLTNPGFLVIRNQANEIIGFVGLIPQGEFKNVKVTLNQLYSSGSVFSAMLHFDDGDGSFDPEKDLPVVDPVGNVVMMQFKFNDSAPKPEDFPLVL